MQQLTIFILIIILLTSCKKDKNITSTPKQQPNYFTFTGQIGTNDNSTVVSPDNNLIICGNTGSNISILKISKTGNQIWRKDFYAGSNSSASSIIQTPNQDFFICGSTSRNYSIQVGTYFL
jgi:hypothetical protein